MHWKNRLKASLPKGLHHLYNRLLSRRRIQKKLGDWFDVDWKGKAPRADDRTWLDTYDRSWDNWRQEDLSPLDLEKIACLIPPQGSVLDAGCGNGYLLNHLRKPDRSLNGLDLSGKALQVARENLGPSVSLVQAFLEAVPFAGQAFDVVISAHTLEHVRNLDQAVAELKRVAKERLIILVPAQEYLRFTEDYHLHFFPKAEDLLRRIGLPQAQCDRYTVPPGLCAYSGEILLLVADL